MWEVGGSRPEHKKFIGKLRTSWSQLESFNDEKGFNTGLLGEYEYIRNYFSLEKYPDMGWSLFGSGTESYVTVRDFDRGKLDQSTLETLEWAEQHFTQEEKDVLNTIETLGEFQHEVCYYVEELDVIILGYIDDMTPPVDNVIELIRDYKTKSEASKKDLHSEKKFQLEIYISAKEQQNYTVRGSEYIVIERFGGRECMMGGGAGVLRLGNKIWREPYRKLTPARKKQMDDMLIKTIIKISDYYKMFLKMTNKS